VGVSKPLLIILMAAAEADAIETQFGNRGTVEAGAIGAQFGLTT